MKILVYGAGPLGSLLAARLVEGGQDVSILARGQRLLDLREHGIILHDIQSGAWTETSLPVVENLASGDEYDLVLVIMRKNHALEILPILAANRTVPNILFLMNNAKGPGELVKALGRERVLIGFPNAAGYRRGPVIHCLAGNEEQPSRIPIGEIDGVIRPRTLDIVGALEQAPGFEVELRPDMDAWLKYHVALLIPSLAPALYACNADHQRLARTRDAVILAVRAAREGFAVLQSLGYPTTPSRFQPLTWLPEPIFVPLIQRFLRNEWIDVALVKHALAAPDEMLHLAEEFQLLIARSGRATPYIDRLHACFDPDTPLIPDGSRELSMDWRSILLGLGVTAALGGMAGIIRRRLMQEPFSEEG